MTNPETAREAAGVQWTGRSGRRYWLNPTSPADLHVAEDTICVLTAMSGDGEAVIWSGTAQSLIAEPANRGLFRSAIRRAAAAYSMPAPDDEIDRMITLWDLESARRPSARSAA